MSQHPTLISCRLTEGFLSPPQIKAHVKARGTKDWAFIGAKLNRTGSQCKSRWAYCLDPSIKRTPWSEREDEVLIRAHRELGANWAQIAKRLPGRPDSQVRNRWISDAFKELYRL